VLIFFVFNYDEITFAPETNKLYILYKINQIIFLLSSC